ncbi:MAG: ABC transporter permease, partial [Acidimicrobiia bacterium]|nr:ABC transporter permease [Acidimicrobiia bacterium]
LDLGLTGLRARPGRSTLTALGIAIGIAAIVAVLGISASGRADLLAALDRLGTNLLRVSPGQGVFGEALALPEVSPEMLGRVGPVQRVSTTSLVNESVRKNELIPGLETGGLSVLATRPNLPEVLAVDVLDGRFIDAATAEVPAAVLGFTAAERLGLIDLDIDATVVIGDTRFAVIGILDKAPLYPDVERSVLIGEGVARALFDPDLAPSAIYARVVLSRVSDVLDVIPSTVNPENPDRVSVTRPSDALAAREAADAALTGLLIGLGSVALLVGGVAIGNIMVMSVLERRMEVGVRRALGATRRHIRVQFLLESVLLAGIGGILGTILGAGITVAYAAVQDLTLAVPVEGLVASIGAALLIGAVAGLYPAIRAARIPPAEAVRSA